MKQLRHIGVLRSVSLGLALVLLAGTVRPFWLVTEASYAAWLRMQLQSMPAEAILEAGLQEALAANPTSLEAFVRAFLQECRQQDGGLSVRAALGLPADASDEAVLVWLLGGVPRLMAEPLLALRWQVASPAFWVSLLRGCAVVLARSAVPWGHLPSMALPLVTDIPNFSPKALLLGAVLPMGP